MEPEEEIRRSNWAVATNYIDQNLLNVAERNAGFDHSQPFRQMLEAVARYKSLFSQGRHCPREALDRALEGAERAIDRFVETCTEKRRMAYCKATLTLITMTLPPGA